MMIVSNKLHNDSQIQILCNTYYQSKEFQIFLLNVCKLDVLYAQSDIIFSSFQKVFSGEFLSAEEYSVIKRVLSDQIIIQSLAEKFSDKDFENFIWSIEKMSGDVIDNFYSPFHQFKQENKEIIITYIISEFLLQIKNNYISHITHESIIGVDTIMSVQSNFSQAELAALNQEVVSESTESLQRVLINHGIVPPQVLTNKQLDAMCTGQASPEDIKI